MVKIKCTAVLVLWIYEASAANLSALATTWKNESINS